MRVTQGESVVVFDAGLYEATVVDVVETVSTYPGSEGKPRLRLVFRVETEEGYSDIWGFSGATMSRHPAATLRPIVAAIRPDLDLDDPELDLEIGHPEDQPASRDDVLIGRACRVLLGVDQERGRNKVEKVLPAEVKRPARPAARPAVAAAVPRRPLAAVGVAEDGEVPF